MVSVVRVNDGMAVGGAPRREDVGRLADEGYRTVVDLRTPREEIPEDVLGVEEEGLAVGKAGMHHENLPVDMAEADEALIGRVGERIRGAEKPVLVHCASGRRAGAMVLMNLAVERGMTVEQCLEWANGMGFDCESQQETKRLVADYIERNSPAYRR